MKPIAVTGVGMVHAHGVRFESLQEAVSARLPPPSPTVEDLDYKAHFPDTSKRIKKMDQVGRYASCAALFALRHAGLEAPPDPARAGLVTGTMFGGLEACAEFHKELVTVGPDAVNPVHFPNTAHNVACGHVAITLGLKGPVLALASGQVASHEAAIAAARLIRAGRADLVVAGGFDRLVPEIEDGLARMGLIAAGLRASEGACFLVLESAAAATARGAEVLAWLHGTGLDSDPVPAGSFDYGGKALSRALARALATSPGVRPGLSVTGADGVAPYDQAIDAAFAAAAPELSMAPRFAPKRIFGETFGAAGSFALAGLLAGWRAGALPREPALVGALAWGGAAAALVASPP